MTDHQVVGKIGRVTGRIEPGRLGEVMISIRGGSEAYHAYGADTSDEIEVELADNLKVRIVKSTLLAVRVKGEPVKDA